MNRNDFDDEEGDDNNNHNNQNKGSSSSSSSSSSNITQLLFEDYEVDSILANHYFEETIVPRELIAIESSSVSIPPVITYIIPGTTTTITSTNIPSSSSNRVEVNIMATNYVQSTQFTQQQQQLHNNPSELAYDKKSSYDRKYNEMKLLHSQLYSTCNYSSVEMNIDDDDDNNCGMKAQRNYQKNQYKYIKEQIFNLIDKKELMVMIDVSYQFIKQFLHDYHDKYQKPRKIIVPKFQDYHRLTMKEKQIIETELTQLYNSEEEFFIILTRAGKCYVLCTYSPLLLVLIINFMIG